MISTGHIFHIQSYKQGESIRKILSMQIEALREWKQVY